MLANLWRIKRRKRLLLEAMQKKKPLLIQASISTTNCIPLVVLTFLTFLVVESGFHKDDTNTDGEVLVYGERLEQLRRKIPVVSDDTIPISLIEFRQKFIDEDAPYGFKQ